jgi:calcium-dependent protein kinase
MDGLHQGTLVGEKTSKITDDYTIVKRLGKGAYSEVFFANQKVSGMQRCVKVTRKKNLDIKDGEAIFEEVRILRDIDHPHIMKVYEYYQDQSSIYIISEYLAGGELFDRIIESKCFNEKTAANYMQQILSAVAYLHGHNVIHRDLKPENIVFESTDAKSNLKIIDFGTSKKVKINERLNAKLGTAYYIAPEVLKNNYDLKCDVWSCGVILYVFLCGYPPFNAKTDDDIFKKILKGSFTFPEEEWQKVSKEARNLITSMLTYDPLARPSAAELLKHPWFSKAQTEISSTETNIAVLKNFSSFYSSSKLQKAILIYFVSFFDIKDEKAKLLQAFKDIDKDHDGQITKEELTEAYRKFASNSLVARDAEDILKKLDFNQTSAIDFSEFLVANVAYMQSLNKQRLRQIFDLIDKDKNGFLTPQELKEFLNLTDKGHESFVSQMIAEVDKNHDGVISFDEFDNMMNGFSKKI